MEESQPREAGPQRLSRTRLFASLPRWSSTAISLRNRAFASDPLLLSDDRILVWQESGLVTPSGELVCAVGQWKLSVAADSLWRLEPRLEALETFVPADTCSALVENALNPVLTAIEQLVGMPLEPGDFVRGRQLDADPSEVSVGFVILERTQRPLLRGWVRTSPDIWQAMDFSRAPSLPLRRIGYVPVALSLRIGGCRLPLEDVTALQAGDALRLAVPAASLDQSVPVHLTDAGGHVGAGLRINARVVGDELVLESNVDTSPIQNAQAGEPGPAVDSVERLADIECDVAFEIATLRMTVAEVARLRNGQALRMGTRLQEQPVRILVNGRMLARGELAAVGDELVVVVTDTSRLPVV